MADATLTINSKNYGAWSLRGWLLCKMAGLEFDEHVLANDDPDTRAEMLLLSSSFLVPAGARRRDRLGHAGDRRVPQRDPAQGRAAAVRRVARAHCRAVCGEMHSGFVNLRSALPMNLKAHLRDFKVWAGAQADIDRIVAIWHECLERTAGRSCSAPAHHGRRDVRAGVHALPHLRRRARRTLRRATATRSRAAGDGEWIAAAEREPDELEELDVEF